MQISNLQGSSSLFAGLSASSASPTPSALSASNTSSSIQEQYDSALAALMSSIRSGNTADAGKYLAELQQLSPPGNSISSPLTEFLSTTSTALSNNNIAAAQSALTTFETETASSSAQTGDSTNSTISTLGQDVLSLFSAISSGDVTDAQYAYQSLTGLLNAGNGSSASTDANTASTGSSRANPFNNLLSEVGTSLSSGNIGIAQSALDGFLQSLSSGSLVNATA